LARKKSNRHKPTSAAPIGTPTQGRWIAGGIVILAVGAVVWLWQSGPGETRVDVRVPKLSPVAKAGRKAFEANCASCHGPMAGGTDQGPPLVHKWYEPSHHGDAAFMLAARRGVPQHHWRFWQHAAAAADR
jgi:mono/diheme cytochrome c family protein